MDEPKPNNDAEQSGSDLPVSNTIPESGPATNAHQASEQPAQQQQYAKYVMWPLKRVKRSFLALVKWLDENNGAITAVATIAIAVLTFVYVRYARKQWEVMGKQLGEMVRQYPELQKSADAAEKAAAATQKQLEMSERPWLSIDFTIDYPIEFQPNGDIGIRIHPIIKNIGHSVATDTQIILLTQPEGRGPWFVEVPKDQKAECEDVRKRNFSLARVPPLFEGQGYTEDTIFTIKKADIDKVVSPQPDGTKAIYGISLYGCLDYRFAFAPEHHQTGFWFSIAEPGLAQRPTQFNQASTGGHLLWTLGKNIPASKLKIVRSGFGGFWVD